MKKYTICHKNETTPTVTAFKAFQTPREAANHAMFFKGREEYNVVEFEQTAERQATVLVNQRHAVPESLGTSAVVETVPVGHSFKVLATVNSFFP